MRLMCQFLAFVVKSQLCHRLQLTRWLSISQVFLKTKIDLTFLLYWEFCRSSCQVCEVHAPDLPWGATPMKKTAQVRSGIPQPHCRNCGPPPGKRTSLLGYLGHICLVNKWTFRRLWTLILTPENKMTMNLFPPVLYYKLFRTMTRSLKHNFDFSFLTILGVYYWKVIYV